VEVLPPADLADNTKMSYQATCPSGKQAIAGGGRGDDNNSEETVMSSSRPARSAADTEPPATGQGFTGWRITVFNPTGSVSGNAIRPQVWVVCVDAATP